MDELQREKCKFSAVDAELNTLRESIKSIKKDNSEIKIQSELIKRTLKKRETEPFLNHLVEKHLFGVSIQFWDNHSEFSSTNFVFFSFFQETPPFYTKFRVFRSKKDNLRRATMQKMM